jgi:hypothetical protein
MLHSASHNDTIALVMRAQHRVKDDRAHQERERLEHERFVDSLSELHMVEKKATALKGIYLPGVRGASKHDEQKKRRLAVARRHQREADERKWMEEEKIRMDEERMRAKAAKVDVVANKKKLRRQRKRADGDEERFLKELQGVYVKPLDPKWKEVSPERERLMKAIKAEHARRALRAEMRADDDRKKARMRMVDEKLERERQTACAIQEAAKVALAAARSAHYAAHVLAPAAIAALEKKLADLAADYERNMEQLRRQEEAEGRRLEWVQKQREKEEAKKRDRARKRAEEAARQEERRHALEKELDKETLALVHEDNWEHQTRTKHEEQARQRHLEEAAEQLQREEDGKQRQWRLRKMKAYHAEEKRVMHSEDKRSRKAMLRAEIEDQMAMDSGGMIAEDELATAIREAIRHENKDPHCVCVYCLEKHALAKEVAEQRRQERAAAAASKAAAAVAIAASLCAHRAAKATIEIIMDAQYVQWLAAEQAGKHDDDPTAEELANVDPVALVKLLAKRKLAKDWARQMARKERRTARRQRRAQSKGQAQLLERTQKNAATMFATVEDEVFAELNGSMKPAEAPRPRGAKTKRSVWSDSDSEHEGDELEDDDGESWDGEPMTALLSDAGDDDGELGLPESRAAVPTTTNDQRDGMHEEGGDEGGEEGARATLPPAMPRLVLPVLL